MKQLAWLAVVTFVVQGPPPPPVDQEVYLAPLTVQGGKLTIGKPVNISNNAGYDNQPSFTPDGKAVLFTSVRGGRTPDPKNAAMTGSDIYRYDIDVEKISQVTNTPESEYSPTVTPDGEHISVIRVEPDGTQRLWRFTLAGADPELVLRDVKPVGYHAWADANTLALFVLGQPNGLHVADVRNGKTDRVASDIGRSLQRMPNGHISFVQKAATTDGQAPALTIVELVPAAREIRPLVRVPAGPADVDTTWTPDGLLLVSSGKKLLGWRAGDSELKEIADLEPLGLSGVSRLAVSPKGDLIALVAPKQ
jgi:hypothetical protein